MSTIAIVEGSAELDAARARYRASIGGDSHSEFVAAKLALIEMQSGRTLTAEEIDYL